MLKEELKRRFRNENSLNRALLILKIIKFCDSSPISTRQLGSILNVNNKTIRYYLKKLNPLVEKKYNLGFILSNKGKKLTKSLDFKLGKEILSILGSIKQSRYYHSIIYKDWKKIIKKQHKNIKNKTLFFHWYHLPDNFTLNVKLSKFRFFLEGVKHNLNIKSDRQFSLRLGYNEKIIRVYMAGINNPSVESIKKICRLSEISYQALELKKMFRINFPIKIDKTVLQLRTHLINEGHLRDDGALYHNYDPVLLKNFQNCVRKITGRTFYPQPTKKDIYIQASKLIAWLIHFTGVGFKKTSKDNPRLHILERNNYTLFKKHMEITFAEEGAFHLILHKKYKNLYTDYFIGLGRTVDVTNDIPISYKNKLEHGYFSFSKLPLDLQTVLSKRRCNLLDDEISTLYKFLKLPLYTFIPKPVRVYKAKNGSISLGWLWSTQNKRIVRALQTFVLPGSWVHRKACKYYGVWNKTVSKKLSKHDVKKVNKIRKYYNRTGVPDFWIKTKMRTYFPKLHITEENLPRK